MLVIGTDPRWMELAICWLFVTLRQSGCWTEYTLVYLTGLIVVAQNLLWDLLKPGSLLHVCFEF